MGSVKFQLKEPKSKDETLLVMVFSYDSKRVKYSTGIFLNKKHWNHKAQQARETKDFTEAAEINSTLKNISTHIHNVYRKLGNDGIVPTNEKLKAGLDEALLKPDILNKKDFIGFIDAIIKSSTKRPNTIKHYGQTLRVLTAFKAISKRELTFANIDLTFYDEFTKYCLKKNYGINTIGGFIKHVKVFMNEAFDRKLTTNLEYKNRKFKTVEEDTENIYLTNDEVEILYNLDLTENPKLDKVRDMFILSCYTGLRYSDLIQLTGENLIDNNTKLKIKTEKTGELVIIPLNKYIKEILVKHNGLPDYTISNQKMNEYLKDLGEKAELDENVLHSFTKGGHKKSESFKKFQLITVHTARRSFATNAYLADVPSISIMKITGHKTEKAFLKYIKISQHDNANKLINHPFFK